MASKQMSQTSASACPTLSKPRKDKERIHDFHLATLISEAVKLIGSGMGENIDEIRHDYLHEIDYYGPVPPMSIRQEAFELALAFWNKTIVPWNKLKRKEWQAIEDKEWNESF
jgi:hypothetical protein